MDETPTTTEASLQLPRELRARLEDGTAPAGTADVLVELVLAALVPSRAEHILRTRLHQGLLAAALLVLGGALSQVAAPVAGAVVAAVGLLVGLHLLDALTDAVHERRRAVAPLRRLHAALVTHLGPSHAALALADAAAAGTAGPAALRAAVTDVVDAAGCAGGHSPLCRHRRSG